MTVIKVPKPPQSAFDKNRPVSALLKNQILHLHEAESRLPVRQQTNIYINKIKTEGEAAEYIREVTAKLHPEAARETRFDIAAMAETKPARKTKAKGKKKSGKPTKPKTKAKSARKRKKS
ncbi:MAG TPA: hypothetical protein VFA74_12635 [Terriglobales bacterium]|nr:hypothetical protein [Terriglobales bacterium]